MPRRFREWLGGGAVVAMRFHEEEAAPPAGAVPPSPGDPTGTTDKYHFDTLQQNLNIGDEAMQAALETPTITVWKVPNYYDRWGYLVSGPVDTKVEKVHGGYNVTYLLKVKKDSEPKSFILPYRKGERPAFYEGEVEDETEFMTDEELQKAMTPMFAAGQGAPPGGGMPGMGGAPPGPTPGGPPGGAPPPGPGGP